MQVNYFFAAGAVAVITGVAHAISGWTITTMRDVAQNNPTRLRGATPAETQAKALDFERNRNRLWPLGLVVAAGLLVLGLVLN
jgi:hypothetical protein